MTQVTVQEVNIEKVQKGRNSYQVAEIVYTTDRGENKTKKVMSFSNPAVFAAAQKLTSGTRVEVENDGAPYYNWTKLDVVGDNTVSTRAVPAAAAASTATKSTYETADERATKQRLIVKQSSISSALEFFKLQAGGKASTVTPNDVFELAQDIVDWVYDTDEAMAALDATNQAVSEE